jgi:hypothetical protein
MPHPVTGRLRALAAGVVVPLLAAGLVACGSEDDAASGDRAASSEGTTRPTPSESGGETPETSLEGEPVDPAEFADQLAAGLADLTTATMTLSLEGPLNLEATGDLDYTRETPAIALRTTGGSLGGSTEVIMVDRVAYVKLPAQKGKYLEVDLSDPDSPLAGTLGGLTDLDPRAAIESFADSVQQVAKVGEEDLDGTATTHYVLTADTSGLAGQFGGGDADLPESVTYDVWLDERDRPRQLEVDLGDRGSLHLEVADFGEPVDIAAPPAREVQRMPGS